MAQPAPFSNVESEEDIAQRRKLALALMGQASDTSPVGHWTQALARAVQGGMSQWGQMEAKGAERDRKKALADALMGAEGFKNLGDSDRAIIAQNPQLMQSVAAKTYAERLDPNADVNRRLLEAKAKNLEAGGERPSNVREWEYFNKLTPAAQQQYLTMKRAEKYLDTGTEFVRPNPVNPTGPAVANIPKNNVAEEAQKGEGKNIAKVRGDLPEARLRTNTVVGALSRLRQTAESLDKQPGLEKIAGGVFQAYTPNLSTGARNAAADLTELKTKISGTVLQSMRDASKTGGAVGQVTEKEWPRLEGMIANLDPSQGIDQFKAKLRDVITYANQVEAMIKEAYAADLKVAQGGEALVRGAQPAAAPSAPVDLKSKYGLE